MCANGCERFAVRGGKYCAECTARRSTSTPSPKTNDLFSPPEPTQEGDDEQ